MTDLTKELNRSQGIPFLEYKHFVTRTFFPKVSLCPPQPRGGSWDSPGCATLEGTYAYGETWLVQCWPLERGKACTPTHRACQEGAQFLPSLLTRCLSVQKPASSLTPSRVLSLPLPSPRGQ